MGTRTTVNEFISPSASEDTASVSRLITIHKEGLEAKLHMSFYYYNEVPVTHCETAEGRLLGKYSLINSTVGPLLFPSVC